MSIFTHKFWLNWQEQRVLDAVKNFADYNINAPITDDNYTGDRKEKLCYYGAIANMYYFNSIGKDIKVCFGTPLPRDTRIAHAWVEVDNKEYHLNQPMFNGKPAECRPLQVIDIPASMTREDIIKLFNGDKLNESMQVKYKIDMDQVKFWQNPEDDTINPLVMYNGRLTRLRTSLIIMKGDQILLSEEDFEPGIFSLPGGGFEPNETPEEAAKREAEEEVFITAKNIRYTGHDYCDEYDYVQDWVKEHVPEEFQWYNYYTCLCIGDYDEKYKGKVDKADLDPSMKANAKFYDLADVINEPSFKTEWKEALVDAGYLGKRIANEDLKDDAKQYFGTTNNIQFAFYINTDGTLLDGSGRNFGNLRPSGRATDHREISGIFDDTISGNDAMLAYLNEGNIRWMPECNGIDLILEPTEAQYRTLSKLIRKVYGEDFLVDISSKNGSVVQSFEYDKASDLIILDIKDYFKDNRLYEDTRSQLVSKSRNVGAYKDQTRGKNRFERKRYSKVATQVKAYNKIDMNKFFKEDILEVDVPVTGETNNYNVTIKMEGICSEIARNIKSNNNKLEFRTIIQSVTKVFNSANIYVRCTCDDFKYRFDHWNIINNVSVNDSAHDPGPGKGIANPNDDKGRGCKHILLVLANGDWLMKVSSVINNYIHYAEEHLQQPFLKVIFPKLYGIPASDMVDEDLIDDDKFLDSSAGLIDAINEYGKNRGKYKAGTNKNPVTGTGGRTKKTTDAEAENADGENTK